MCAAQIADATDTYNFFQLSLISCWHMESEAINRALAMIIEAQSKLPMAQFWDAGETASSDGQFFPTTRHPETASSMR
ncbi:Tn3 family transposase [Phaeobacter inhibens]|nr:Tn3 family transposase [Phaeobacter inhibens]